MKMQVRLLLSAAFVALALGWIGLRVQTSALAQKIEVHR
jgi:hypothetical protein